MDNQQQSAEIICQRLRNDAQKEAELILQKIERNAKLQIKLAEAEAKRYLLDQKEEAQKNAEEYYKKLFSNINLQTRKIVDRAKEELINLAFEELKASGIDFRFDKEYVSWLTSVVIEGVLNIAEVDSDSVASSERFAVKVVASVLDINIFSDYFVAGVKRELKNSHKIEADIKVLFDEKNQDIGVCVKSEDERIIFYNTFLSRVERQKERLRLIMFKELFTDA
jgi:vacuolar-type H+-ATPase subunit E/Vma4